MKTDDRLEFTSFDGRTKARVGHGADCVMISLETSFGNLASTIILNADEAEQMAGNLRREARRSREAARHNASVNAADITLPLTRLRP